MAEGDARERLNPRRPAEFVQDFAEEQLAVAILVAKGEGPEGVGTPLEVDSEVPHTQGDAPVPLNGRDRPDKNPRAFGSSVQAGRPRVNSEINGHLARCRRGHTGQPCDNNSDMPCSRQRGPRCSGHDLSPAGQQHVRDASSDTQR